MCTNMNSVKGKYAIAFYCMVTLHDIHLTHFFPFFIADDLLCHSFFHSQGQHAIGVFGTDVLNLLFICLLSYPCSELTS